MLHIGSLIQVINEGVADTIKSIPGKINNKIDDVIRWKANNDASDTATGDRYGYFSNKRKIYRDQFNKAYKEKVKWLKNEEKEEDRDWKKFMREQRKKKIAEIKKKYR